LYPVNRRDEKEYPVNFMKYLEAFSTGNTSRIAVNAEYNGN
jgi:hypothetical protein